MASATFCKSEPLLSVQVTEVHVTQWSDGSGDEWYDFGVAMASHGCMWLSTKTTTATDGTGALETFIFLSKGATKGHYN